VSQTENTSAESSGGGEERIRKIYAKDLKAGETVHTVFRATKKERHTSRVGKPYMTMTLTDRTGEVDARIFDNVDGAEAAFTDGDYLLVQGKIGSFHGRAQIVIDRLERLDPEPIDPAEFAFTAPPAPPVAEERPKKAERDEAAPRELKLPRRVQKLLEQPQVAQAFDALLGYIDRLVEEKVAARLGGGAAEKPEAPTRAERKHRDREPRPPKVEHKPRPEEPRRDPSLPEGLAFKPFTQLVGGETKEPAAPSNPPSTEG
jgi:RecG-like helicase